MTDTIRMRSILVSMTFYCFGYTRGMQSIVGRAGRAELAIAVQPHRRAAELSGLLHIVLLYEVGIR